MCIFCHQASCFACDAGPGGAAASVTKKFRFSRADFGALTFTPLHYDLSFLFPLDSTTVQVISRQTYRNTSGEAQGSITLDAHDLELRSVEVAQGQHRPLGPPPSAQAPQLPDFVAHVAELESLRTAAADFIYDKERRKVTIAVPGGVAPGGEFVVRTVSTCQPDDRNLEGIYFDFTPPGAPQTMISQCQQYGFQRIVPCIDTMNGKTFYTTRIRASERYTNIASNGDLQGGGSRQVAGAPGLVEATYHNHKVNMAPYLFFIGVGTYETSVSEVEYPGGQRFKVELLALPGVVGRPEDAAAALKALVDSIMWTHVSTGREQYRHTAERRRIYELLPERDSLKSSGADPKRLEDIRRELKALIGKWGETGYTYTGTCYREIGMENSNYGGMENVGNTTILSSRLTPSHWLGDAGFVYMEGVKAHEFYHNINGSQVTGSSPFEIWLNEAVTVHIQRQREDALFGHAWMRLSQVIGARWPGSGPLALDRAVTSMAVEPEGFNTTHELISAMTYFKAPEFVRMTELVVGREQFVRGLADYHARFAFSNATSAQWVDAMAHFAPPGLDLRQFAAGWLKRTGYPTVTMESIEDGAAGGVAVRLSQAGPQAEPWCVPLAWAAVKGGRAVQSGVFILDSPAAVLRIEGSQKEWDFLSMACDWSFYGEMRDLASTPHQKLLQARSDPDVVNRYLAFQSILDDEKARLVLALRARRGAAASLPPEVSQAFVELYGAVLRDPLMAHKPKEYFLEVSKACPGRPEVRHLYAELEEARRLILRAVGAAHAAPLLQLFHELKQDSQILTRGLKQVVFAAIRHSGIAGDEGATRGLVRELLESEHMSDRAFALRQLMELNDPHAQATARRDWTQHPIGCEAYITIVGSADCTNAEHNIRELLKEPFFKMALAGHARGVARAWCSNLRRALLTDRGLRLTKELFLRVGKVNQMSAYGFIGAFGDVGKFEGKERARLMGALRDMRAGLDPKSQESLYNQFTNMLKSFGEADKPRRGLVKLGAAAAVLGAGLIAALKRRRA